MSSVRLLSHEYISVNKGYLYYISGYIIFELWQVPYIIRDLQNVNIVYVLSDWKEILLNLFRLKV